MLAGKSILITGAAHGIGAETARRLADSGCGLTLVDVDAAALMQLAADWPHAAIAAADVSSLAELERAAQKARCRFGGIDAVVTCAGIAPMGMTRMIDPGTFEATVDVNLLGVWRTIRACLPYVIERHGYLLPVASMGAIAQPPGLAAYQAAKAGVEAFSNSLRAEVAHLGVQVGRAYFSWSDTPMVRGADGRDAGTRVRAALPGLLAKTCPVERAAEAIVRGIERRSAYVVAPGRVRPLMYARGLIQSRPLRHWTRESIGIHL